MAIVIQNNSERVERGRTRATERWVIVELTDGLYGIRADCVEHILTVDPDAWGRVDSEIGSLVGFHEWENETLLGFDLYGHLRFAADGEVPKSETSLEEFGGAVVIRVGETVAAMLVREIVELTELVGEKIRWPTGVVEAAVERTYRGACVRDAAVTLLLDMEVLMPANLRRFVADVLSELDCKS